MARKRDAFYFDSVAACADCALRAARLLAGTLEGFSAEALEHRREEMRAVEREADEKRHELLDALAAAFITPLDREDLVELSGAVDSVTDAVGDVLDTVYVNDVRMMRPDALGMAALVVQGCEEVRALVRELPQMGKSKALRGRVVAVNAVEDRADKLLVEALRRLRTESLEPLDVMAWHEVYRALERCVDSCEHVAETMDVLAMKNG